MADSRQQTSDLPGPTIRDRYVVMRELGRGASARTLLCQDTQASHPVVLKQLHAKHLESWKHYELFEREARVLAGLSHHGIPEVFDVFRIDEPETELYLVQEYIEGRSLKSLIDDGPRPSRLELVQIATGVLDILDYLHSRTPPVYHRDIKPSNLIVRPMGAPVLVDFGGVRDVWREDDEGASTVVGTHGYMPPEQYLGQVCPESDLYALGATLLHVVTGRPPSDFSFDSGRLELPDDLPVDPGLDRLIRAVLEPAPRDRPQSAREARDLLQSRGPVEETGLVRYDRRGTALQPRGAGLVELGSPPRSPGGALRDVYHNLVPSYLKAVPVRRGKPSEPVTGWELVAFALLTCLTFFVWPIIALVAHQRRYSQYDELFRTGRSTQGRIVSVVGNEGLTTYIYDFDVRGQTYRGSTKYSAQVGQLFAVGDPVAVLYRADDPNANAVVFR